VQAILNSILDRSHFPDRIVFIMSVDETSMWPGWMIGF
jgi:hypothetical protein